MLIYAVDLGTTNIKVVLYDETLQALAIRRAPMRYQRTGAQVEFDPAALVPQVTELIRRCAQSLDTPTAAAYIVVTGQAESLVLVDAAGAPVAPGISWMDERSTLEAEQIADYIDPAAAFAITGQPQPVATWPATKLRWLARHRPEVIVATHQVLMIKDYLLLALTGFGVGEVTTRGFTYLYDIPGRRYWADMVDFCGIAPTQLPEVVPAGTEIGPVRAAMLPELPPAASYRVNAGALDHFCAMLGMDAYRPGELSASAGTVLSLAMLASPWHFDPALEMSFHPGLNEDDTVLFACADSGGGSLDWFREAVAHELSYAALERELTTRDPRAAPLFLPYLTGLNPPDFDPAARGAFLGLQSRHDRIDLAYSVMEGVAHLLRRNLDHLAQHGHTSDAIVSSGGGTASPIWNQLKADVCGLDLRTSAEPEATCRGAARLTLEAAAPGASHHLPPAVTQRYQACREPWREHRYAAFNTAVRHPAVFPALPAPGPNADEGDPT